MFEIILLAYLSYRNGIMAKLKGQNTFAWALYTVLAYVICMMIGSFVVILYFCRDVISIDQLVALDPKVGAARLQQVFLDHPLHLITIEMFGIGGYLFVRYLLERKPGKDNPSVHWMDKMGGEQ